MTEIKPIFVLPELTENQEWACVQGCSVHNPRLYKNVYSQQWDLNGNLVKELFEEYYACQRGHLLMVWDNNTNDYVDLPEQHYKDQTDMLPESVLQSLGEVS